MELPEAKEENLGLRLHILIAKKIYSRSRLFICSSHICNTFI